MHGVPRSEACVTALAYPGPVTAQPRPVSAILITAVVVVTGAISATTSSAASQEVPVTAAVRADSNVSAKVSRKATVAGGRVVVKGRVSGAGVRAVILETKVPGSWRPLATGRTDAQGRYRLRLPTTWYHRHTLRVRAPARGGRPAGTSRSRSVRVKPAYQPAGARSDYDLAFENARWNPCKPIAWRFHQGGGFGGSLQVAKRAVGEISLASGLAFTYAGTTSKVPVRDANGNVADLVIGWATPQQVSQLSGGTVGFAQASASGPSQQRLEINEAAVALDQTDSLAEAYAVDGRVAWGQVMVHEIGHAIGLSHTSASDQVMFGTATTVQLAARQGRPARHGPGRPVTGLLGPGRSPASEAEQRAQRASTKPRTVTRSDGLSVSGASEARRRSLRADHRRLSSERQRASTKPREPTAYANDSAR